MSNLAIGSRGDDVLKLQQQLRAAGYNIAADGAFGAQTQAAVKDYQQRNGLLVDGIVGSQTMGKLNGTTNTPTSPAVSVSGAGNSGGSNLGSVATPGYNSPYEAQLNDLYDKISNREKFRYSLGDDSLYQQYRKQYINLGRRAMQDTIGKTAALTGGYASSYGQTAGGQAYERYLGQLNDIVPQLEARAYERYRAEGDDLATRYSILSARNKDNYQRYRDQVADSQWERQFAASQAARSGSGSGGGSGTGSGVDWYKVEMQGAMANLKDGVDAAAINEGLNDDVREGRLTLAQKNAIMDNVKGYALTEYYKKRVTK